jgi:hypothetical protein
VILHKNCYFCNSNYQHGHVTTSIKVKLSHYRPGEALRAPRGRTPPEFLDNWHLEVVQLPLFPRRYPGSGTAAFIPQEISRKWYSCLYSPGDIPEVVQLPLFPRRYPGSGTAAFIPQEVSLVLIPVRGSVDPGATMQIEGLRIKNLKHLINLLACSTVP